MTTEHERRQNERKTIAREINGEFQITIDGKSYPIVNVTDVSISGIGLCFPQEVATDTSIRLNYSAPDFKLAINGRVAWCTENKDPAPESTNAGAYQIGIEFDPTNMDHNCLLFMALRKYLDDFE